MRSFVFVCVAAVVVALSGCAHGTIVDLTDENASSFIRQSEDLLIICCAHGKAPVCKYIQSFIPELEDFLEDTMPSHFEAGYLELSLSRTTANELQAKMGEMLLFRDGALHSRHQVADKEKAIEWIEAHTSRALPEIKTKEEFDRFVDDVDHKHATVVLFGGDSEDQLHKQLLEFSHVFFDSFYVKAIYDQQLIDAILDPKDREKNVWVYRHFGYVNEADLGFVGTESNWDELRHNLMLEGSPVVHMYDNQEVVRMGALTKEVVVIVHMKESDDSTLEMITHVAVENNRYQKVGFFWHFDDLLNEQLTRLDMEEHVGTLPFAVATTRAQRDSMRKNTGKLFPIPFYWDVKVEFNRETFSRWVDDIAAGKYDFREISQSEAELAGEPPHGLRRFSRKSLDEFTKSSHKDILLAYVGPVGMCGGECEIMTHILKELNESYPYRERLEFATIDATRNYLADMGGRFPGYILIRNNGGSLTPLEAPLRDTRSVGRWLDGFYKPKRTHDEF